MNAAIRSVVRTCAYHNIECIGFIEVMGMIEGDFKEMGLVNNIVNKGHGSKICGSTEFRTWKVEKHTTIL
jgi:6-phosphofructokinase 1